MIEQKNLASSFTLPGNSMTLNRMGYGGYATGRPGRMGTAAGCQCRRSCSS